MDVCGTLSFTSLHQNNHRLCCKFNQHKMLVADQGRRMIELFEKSNHPERNSYRHYPWKASKKNYIFQPIIIDPDRLPIPRFVGGHDNRRDTYFPDHAWSVPVESWHKNSCLSGLGYNILSSYRINIQPPMTRRWRWLPASIPKNQVQSHSLQICKTPSGSFAHFCFKQLTGIST